MRVLLTTDTIGGVWTFTMELARGLLAINHEVALVSFGRLPSAAQAGEIDALTADYTAFLYFSSDAPLEWMEHNVDTSLECERFLAGVMDSFAPDVLHSGQFCFGRFSSRLPVVVTAHSDVLSWAESTLASNGGVAELERTASADWLQTYRQLVQEGLAQATRVIAPTAWMAQELARLYDLPGECGVIHNGIDPIDSAVKSRKLQAVTAGRLWDQAKGLGILSEISAPFPILVAGELPATPQPTSATLLGSLPRRALLELFAESAVYLAPSVYEPFGLALLEAALCGCAIVARDLPSFREVWADAAFYFDSRTSLERLLSSLASRPRRLKAAQCRARQRAARYTANAMTQQYISVYEELLAAPNATQELSLAHA